MGLKIRNGVDVQKLIGKAKVNELRHVLQNRLDSVMLDMRAELIARTLRGVDMDGSGFKGYSERYKAYKAGKYEKADGTGYSSTTVNLSDTGDMLKAIQLTTKPLARKIVSKLSFSNKDDAGKARGHQFGGGKSKLPVRKFFGLSDEQIARIKKALLGK